MNASQRRKINPNEHNNGTTFLLSVQQKYHSIPFSLMVILCIYMSFFFLLVFGIPKNHYYYLLVVRTLSVLWDIYVKMLHQLLLLPSNRIFSSHRDNPSLCEKGEKEETHTIFNIFAFLPHPPFRKKPLKHAHTESGNK